MLSGPRIGPVLLTMLPCQAHGHHHHHVDLSHGTAAIDSSGSTAVVTAGREDPSLVNWTALGAEESPHHYQLGCTETPEDWPLPSGLRWTLKRAPTIINWAVLKPRRAGPYQVDCAGTSKTLPWSAALHWTTLDCSRPWATPHHAAIQPVRVVAGLLCRLLRIERDEAKPPRLAGDAVPHDDLRRIAGGERGSASNAPCLQRRLDQPWLLMLWDLRHCHIVASSSTTATSITAAGSTCSIAERQDPATMYTGLTTSWIDPYLAKCSLSLSAEAVSRLSAVRCVPDLDCQVAVSACNVTFGCAPSFVSQDRPPRNIFLQTVPE